MTKNPLALKETSRKRKLDKWDEKTKKWFFGCLHNSLSNNVQICNLMYILFFFGPLQDDFFKDVKSLHLIMLLKQTGKQGGRRRARKKLVCYFESFFSWYSNRDKRRDVNDSNWWYLIMVNEGVIIIKHAQILSWTLRLSLLKKKCNYLMSLCKLIFVALFTIIIPNKNRKGTAIKIN